MMPRSTSWALSILALTAACTTTPDAPNPQPDVTRILGAPLAIAFKIPACAVSLGATAVGAGALELAAANDRERSLRRSLDYGLQRNCGPFDAVAPR
jgi:hypothetical protein